MSWSAAQNHTRECCCWSSLQLPEPARVPETYPSGMVSVTAFPKHLCLSRADSSPCRQTESSTGGQGSAPALSSSAGLGLQPPTGSSLASHACPRRAPWEQFGAGWCHLSSHSQWYFGGGGGEPHGASRAWRPPEECGRQGSVGVHVVTSLEGFSPAF